MGIRLYDAHNHLQDERLKPHWEVIRPALEREGVVRMVVNGAGEKDWAEVLALARQWPLGATLSPRPIFSRPQLMTA